MKVVILAGGLGTRLSEETALRPKPMVEIGGVPILVHIMRWYAHYGFNEFVIALGYKGEQIKQYFLDYYALNSNITVTLKDGNAIMSRDEGAHDDWVVHLVDTGLNTLTGGRLARLRRWLTDDEFLLTYGDGLADVDLARLVRCHRDEGRLATLTAVRPPSRFGALQMEGSQITDFIEKPAGGEIWTNGGYFVLNRAVLDRLNPNSPMWEQEPLQSLAAEGQLTAYKHSGFWQAMDNVREKALLEEIWATGNAPWVGR